MEEVGWSMVKKEPEDDNWFLRFLTKHDRRRIILDAINKKPYMFRYFLLWKDHDGNGGGPVSKFNIFIHKIVQDDPRHLHDHPFWYFTIILKGGYWEHTPKGKFFRKPGYFSLRKAKSLHRLETCGPGQPCWTLFVRFKRIRPWGFVFNGKWINKNEYFAGRYYDQ